PDLVAGEALLSDLVVTGNREHRRQHVDVRTDAVQGDAGLDLVRPAHETRHAPAAFPTRVLLTAERSVSSVGPGVVLWTVVGGIHDDGVVGDAQVVELLEQLADL